MRKRPLCTAAVAVLILLAAVLSLIHILACMAVKTVIDIFEEEKIVEHVNEVSEYLTERLEELVQHVDGVLERKGTGLMQGIVLKKPVAQVNNRAIEEGLLVIQAQGNVPVSYTHLDVYKRQLYRYLRDLQCHAL